MKQQQKIYLDSRLREVKSDLVLKLQGLYKVPETLSMKDKIELILAGEAPLNRKELEKMLLQERAGGGTRWNYWNDVFDFSVQDRELERQRAPYNKSLEALNSLFQEAKDTIMLGSESEALSLLKKLQETDLSALVKRNPPVAPAKTAKKKAKS